MTDVLLHITPTNFFRNMIFGMDNGAPVASDLARKQDSVIAVSYLQPTQLSPATTYPADYLHCSTLSTPLLNMTPTPVRAKPHRRVKPGYKSPSTIQHSKARRRFFNNWEILAEYYAMDSQEVQFAAQDYYFKF